METKNQSVNNKKVPSTKKAVAALAVMIAMILGTVLVYANEVGMWLT